MSSNGVTTTEEADMAECDGEKVVTMMDVLQEQEEFEEDANAVLGASDDKNCTYPKGYIKRQAIYACLTCCDAKTDPEKRAGVCLACSLMCHENHELIELYTKRNFACDCGNPKFNSHPCQFTPNKTDLNENNNYNQNFSGLYCVCHRPYPDPEYPIDDEMIQCIICEDWLHASHLEATVPANEHYSEMVCKACMENNDFLHDYSNLAIGECGDVDVVNINSNTDMINDSTLTNGKLDKELLNTTGDIEMTEVRGNEKITPNIDTTNENTEDIIKTDIQKNELLEEMNVPIENEKLETSPHKNVIKDNVDVECSTNVPEVLNIEHEKLSNMEVQPSGNNVDTDSIQHDDNINKVELEQNETMTTTETSSGDAAPPIAEINNTDEKDNSNNSSKDISAVETLLSQTETNNEDDLLTDKISHETNLQEDNDLNDTSVNADINTDGPSIENKEKESNSEIEDKSEIDKDESLCNTVDSTTNTIIESNVTQENDEINLPDSSATEMKNRNEIDDSGDNASVSNSTNIVSNDVDKMDTPNELLNTRIDNLKYDAPMTDNNDSLANSNVNNEHIDNNDEMCNENKRKFAEDSLQESSAKKPKFEEIVMCVRPKGAKRIFKGATFWPSNFRQKLCTCNECISMYKDLSVLFLIDYEDTVTAYETLGKERTEGTSVSQYEKGLQALSSLDRIQQINALTEYNKMRDKLLDFLQSFKDRKEIVKEEDIKSFFAGIKAKREPDGVYFCR